MLVGTKERAQLMRTEIEGSQIEARDYFTSCALAVDWHKYEDFKELDDLRRSTTVVGYLPIHLVVLLAIDAAEMMDSLGEDWLKKIARKEALANSCFLAC
jgi:hypothetical protein